MRSLYLLIQIMLFYCNCVTSNEKKIFCLTGDKKIFNTNTKISDSTNNIKKFLKICENYEERFVSNKAEISSQNFDYRKTRNIQDESISHNENLINRVPIITEENSFTTSQNLFLETEISTTTTNPSTHNTNKIDINYSTTEKTLLTTLCNITNNVSTTENLLSKTLTTKIQENVPLIESRITETNKTVPLVESATLLNILTTNSFQKVNFSKWNNNEKNSTKYFEDIIKAGNKHYIQKEYTDNTVENTTQVIYDWNNNSHKNSSLYKKQFKDFKSNLNIDNYTYVGKTNSDQIVYTINGKTYSNVKKNISLKNFSNSSDYIEKYNSSSSRIFN